MVRLIPLLLLASSAVARVDSKPPALWAHIVGAIADAKIYPSTSQFWEQASGFKSIAAAAETAAQRSESAGSFDGKSLDEKVVHQMLVFSKTAIDLAVAQRDATCNNVSRGCLPSALAYYTEHLVAWVEGVPDDGPDKMDAVTTLGIVADLIADIHNPMHVALHADDGGRLCDVSLNRNKTTLRDVWDKWLFQGLCHSLEPINCTAFVDELVGSINVTMVQQSQIGLGLLTKKEALWHTMQVWTRETFQVSGAIAYNFSLWDPPAAAAAVGPGGDGDGGGLRPTPRPAKVAYMFAGAGACTGAGAGAVQRGSAPRQPPPTVTVVPLSEEYRKRAVVQLRRQLIFGGLRLASTLNRATWDENPSSHDLTPKAAILWTSVIGSVFVLGCLSWFVVLSPMLQRQLRNADGISEYQQLDDGSANGNANGNANAVAVPRADANDGERQRARAADMPGRSNR